MSAPALVAALFAARIIVLWGRPVEWSAELIVASVGQDALVAAGAAALDALLYRRPLGRRIMAMVVWLVVAYVAINAVVARVVPTPLTWPMIQATGAPMADSLRLYATWTSLTALVVVLMAAIVGTRAGRRLSVRRMWVSAAILGIVGIGGVMTGSRVETWGLHRNAVVTLVASALPAIDAGTSDGDWRVPPAGPRTADSGPWTEDRGLRTEGLRTEDLSGIAAGRNVVVIGLESVGALYLKMYGAQENVMPRLDALAAHAIVFNSAYAVSPDSIRSLYSVLCSRYPAFDIGVEAYAAGRCGTLADALRQRGYQTALFHSGRFSYLGMEGVIRNRGFDTLEDAGHVGGNHESSFGVDEPAAVARILAWIDSLASSEPFALTYMPVAGHHPYVFEGPGAFGAATDLDRYRSALHSGDAAIGVLLDGLVSRGLFEQTMFVVYGDHGQAFGQHPGNVGHTFQLYEENVRVPFFVALPGAVKREVRSDIAASLIDVTPTMFELMGLQPDPRHQGLSALTGPSRMALLFTDYGDRLVGLRDGRWKFIHDLGTHRSRLFDLDRDPSEAHDLSAHESERVAAYTRTLRAWSAAQKALLQGHQ